MSDGSESGRATPVHAVARLFSNLPGAGTAMEGHTGTCRSTSVLEPARRRYRHGGPHRYMPQHICSRICPAPVPPWRATPEHAAAHPGGLQRKSALSAFFLLKSLIPRKVGINNIHYTGLELCNDAGCVFPRREMEENANDGNLVQAILK